MPSGNSHSISIGILTTRSRFKDLACGQSFCASGIYPLLSRELFTRTGYFYAPDTLALRNAYANARLHRTALGIRCPLSRISLQERPGALARDHNPHSDPLKFLAIHRADIPKAREGKHKKIVAQILHHLDRLAPGTALKLSLASLPDSKANIRAALNRATRKEGLLVATSSDPKHLFIWKVTGKS
ncbi:MAG: hypothetical protein WBP90_05295 [Terracidiphilus sp.]